MLVKSSLSLGPPLSHVYALLNEACLQAPLPWIHASKKQQGDLAAKKTKKGGGCAVAPVQEYVSVNALPFLYRSATSLAMVLSFGKSTAAPETMQKS